MRAVNRRKVHPWGEYYCTLSVPSLFTPLQVDHYYSDIDMISSGSGNNRAMFADASEKRSAWQKPKSTYCINNTVLLLRDLQRYRQSDPDYVCTGVSGIHQEGCFVWGDQVHHRIKINRWSTKNTVALWLPVLPCRGQHRSKRAK